MENEYTVADDDLVLIGQPNRLLKAAVVHERAVTAAEVNQPKFADILDIDDGVPTRHFWRVQDDGTLRSPTNRTIAEDGKPFASRFQPGAMHFFLFNAGRWLTAA